MESDKIAAYVREYSEIKGLQHKSRVEYTLLRQGGGLSLSVGLETGDPVSGRKKVCGLHGLTEEFAEGILLFLYENSVGPENMADILQDLCAICVTKQ